MVSLEDLLALAQPIEYAVPSGKHEVQQYAPAQWEEGAWNLLELYLVEPETYKFSSFISLVDFLSVLYSPSQSPKTGDAAKHITMVFNTQKLRDNPPYTAKDARVWLWQSQTAIGMTTLPFEQFSTNKHW